MRNRCFNLDKFRVFNKIDCQEFGGSFQDYLGGVADIQGRINRNSLVLYTWRFKPRGYQSYVLWTGSPQVIYFELCSLGTYVWVVLCNRLSLVPLNRPLNLQVIILSDNKDSHSLEMKRQKPWITRDADFIIFIIIYTLKYVHQKCQWLKCNKAEDEQYSTAGGSPPPMCVSPCGLEHW